jgi:hypothetical protein
MKRTITTPTQIQFYEWIGNKTLFPIFQRIAILIEIKTQGLPARLFNLATRNKPQ